MNIDITNIMTALIGACIAIATSILVPWIKTKLNANQIEIVQQLATIAVYAAQQLYHSDEGQAKKDYALEYVQNALEAYHITLSAEAISTYIEGALKNIKVDDGNKW